VKTLWNVLINLEWALDKSDLPFRVVVLAREDISKNFQNLIEKNFLMFQEKNSGKWDT